MLDCSVFFSAGLERATSPDFDEALFAESRLTDNSRVNSSILVASCDSHIPAAMSFFSKCDVRTSFSAESLSLSTA